VAWLADWWDVVSGTVLQGLGITVVGMALVFFTLGLVILAMVLLTRLPGLRTKRPSPGPPPTASRPAETVAPAAAQQDDLVKIAAIAVGVLHSRHRTPSRQRVAARRSTWKSYGRAHQLGL
jgi:sodium pump decarboxylase gamma subunit